MDWRDLKASTLWWNGSKWLTGHDEPNRLDGKLLPEECLPEMKAKDRKAELARDPSAFTVNGQPASLNTAIECRAFSCLERLLRVTALAFKFIKLLKAKHRGAEQFSWRKLNCVR